MPDLAAGLAGSGSLKDYGPAPAFTGISTWINSKPLTLQHCFEAGSCSSTSGPTPASTACARCPHLKAWDAAYRKAGLTIVGVHTPEFAFEHVPSNVRKASASSASDYPVAIDDDYRTWDAYQNDAWPAEYLIDGSGHIREIKKGEGTYDETERTIRKLLGEPAGAQLASVKDTHARASDDARVLPRLGAAASATVGPRPCRERPVALQVPAMRLPLNDARLRRPLARRAAAHRSPSSARGSGSTSSRRTSTS